MNDSEIDWRWCPEGRHYWNAETGLRREPPAGETFLSPQENCPRHAEMAKAKKEARGA